MKIFLHYNVANSFCVVFLIVCAKGNNDSSQKAKNISKRYDIDMQTCIENFDVHQDKIIRTQDSVAMGAKYINELDLSSREECLRLCCETVNCDVFVFEEKTPGSCYLFHCGSPDDFKCKFTKHSNYTSAILTVNKHLTELETQIKFTKHEQELNRLRRPGQNPESMANSTTPPPPPVPKATMQQLVSNNGHNNTQGYFWKYALIRVECVRKTWEKTSHSVPDHRPQSKIPRHWSHQDLSLMKHLRPVQLLWSCRSLNEPAEGRESSKKLCRRCSIYQFECHNSGECIAIYNACDGIPQCADGSDEAVELDCPSGQVVGSTPAPVATMHGNSNNNEAKSGQYHRPPSEQERPPVPSYHNAQNWQPEPEPIPPYAGNSGNRYSANQKMLPVNTQNLQRQQMIEEEQILRKQKQHQGPPQHPQNPHTHTGYDWQQQPYYGPDPRQSEDQGSHIFNHKTNGLMAETDSPVNSYENSRSEYKYNNAPVKTYYGNNNNSPFQPPRGNNWQQRQQFSHGQDFDESNRNYKTGPDSYGPQSFQPDYYDEETQDNTRYHQHPPGYQQAQLSHTDGRDTPNGKVKQDLDTVSSSSDVKPNTELKRRKGTIDVHVLKTESTTPTTTTTTTTPTSSAGKKDVPNEHLSQEEKLVMELVEEEVVSGNPSGAILSLSLGLSIMSVLIGLLACRLRVVRRHLRRGGKSPYAHDADYLVNGMYL